jgi:plasmid stabilization system protein ParE
VTSLRLRPETESDIYEAYSWYETQSPGLGTAFLDSIQMALQAIRENPRRFPVLLDDPTMPVRRALTGKFPYGVYFTLLESDMSVNVIACMHAKREPGRWLRRVR